MNDVMTELREMLDEAGFAWKDKSGEIGYLYIERTHVLDDKGEFLASCAYGSMTYGYPDVVECDFVDFDHEPIPMSNESIIEHLKELTK